MLTLLYLALQNISKKWNLPIRSWKLALNQLAIFFEDRIPILWPAGCLYNLLYLTDTEFRLNCFFHKLSKRSAMFFVSSLQKFQRDLSDPFSA
ncbi:MAG TPA: hypothetical protein VJ974_02890 [Geopsychrobacteraceae bacterium]|nr:hypothetical protein [Geopsychrobacteraceae bacterium]